MIRVDYYQNILDYQRDTPVLQEWRPGTPVREYLGLVDLSSKIYDVTLDGRRLSGEEVDTLVPDDGSRIVCAQVPGIFAALLPATAGVGATILAAVADFILVSAISIGLSYGIAALQGPTKRARYGRSGDEFTNFTGIQDTTGNGWPIPYVYGTIRKGGHFLQTYERDVEGLDVADGVTVIYSLLGLCIGPIQSVSEIQLDGNELDDVLKSEEAPPVGVLAARPKSTADVEYDIRLGAMEQSFIPGFGEINAQKIHARPLVQAEGPRSFFTVDECDAFEVTIRFPGGLFKQTLDGMSQATVEVLIEYRPFGSSNQFYTELRKKISAKTRSPFKAQIRTNPLEHSKYEIRITRLTADDTALSTSKSQWNTQSEVYAITEIRDEASSHPGIAMVGLRQIPSSQVNSSAPTNFTFLVKGFNDIRIYSDEVTYTVGWTDNPAWCTAHFLTSPRHGLGDRYNWTNIDLPSFLEWAAHCNALVPDGKGGLHKRAVLNFEGSQQIAGNRVLEIMTQGSGASLVKWGSKWRVVLDRVEQMVWCFNEGNITPGSDRVDWIERKLRANRIQARFQDEEKDYQEDSHSLPLPDLLQGDQYVDTSRTLEGVTNRSRVEAILTRLLLHNKLEDKQITLRAGLDSLDVRVGAPFGVCLKSTGIGLAGGRVLDFDSTETLLEIDEEVVLETGKTYEIVVCHLAGGSVDTRKIVSQPGTHRHLAVSGAGWQHPLSRGDLYSLGETAVEVYRCVKTTLSDDFQREITGTLYDQNVYTDDLTVGQTVLAQSLPDPRKVLPDVSELLLTERQELAQDGTLVDVVDVDWTPPIAATLAHCEVYARETGSTAWELRGTTTNRHFELKPIQSPGYAIDVTVVPVSTFGVRKSPNVTPRASLTTLGVLTQPPTLTNLRAFIIDGTLVALVDPAPQGTLGPGGKYRWKMGASWAGSTVLEETAAPRLEIKSYSRGSIVLQVRAVNSVGNESPESATFSLTLYGQVEENVILTQVEEPGWSGTKIGLQVDGSNRLTLYEPSAASVFLPHRPRRRRGARWLSFGFPAPGPRVTLQGYYTTSIITASSGLTVLARADVKVSFSPISIGLGTFAAATFPFSDPKAQIPFSGLEENKVTVAIERRISTTTNAESSFGPWTRHDPRAELSMKYIQFRLKVDVATDAYSVEIDSMKISIDLPEKWYSNTHTQVSATSFTVTYPVGYFVATRRLIGNVIGGNAGDTFRVISENGTNKETGFTGAIYDSANALTTGTVHFEVLGY